MPSLPSFVLAAVRDPGGVPEEISALVPSLARHRYLLLTTTKRDGTKVGTPIWFAVDGDALVATTASSSWKVKRLRREPEATVAPCDVRGRPLGDPLHVVGEIISDTGQQGRVQQALSRRYGAAFFAIGVVGRVLQRGRAPQRAYLALRPT